MNLRTTILSFLIALSTFALYAKDLLNIPNVEAATIGIYIEDLKTGKVLASQNANKVMTPASVTKSITSAAAMMLIDKDFQFETYVYLIGDTTIHEGALNCDIMIDACADPTIESEHFPQNKIFLKSIVNKLKERGIVKINGNIIFRNNRVNLSNITSTWMVEDVLWDYGTELRAFNYKDNRFDIILPTATSLPIVVPYIEDIIISNELTIGEKNNITLTRHKNRNKLTLSGTIKSNVINYKIGCSTPDPIDQITSDIKNLLVLNEISFNNDCINNYSDTLLLYKHKSPKRDEILRSLMVRSDNLFADAMMQAISPIGCAIDSVIAHFKSLNIDCQTISLYDGCGLSRVDQLTPRFIADVYRYMYNSNICTDYVALFPKSGIDGTMKNFLINTRLHGKLALKTGSMSGVQCYAGYKLNDNGEPTHIVIIMANNFFCKRTELRKDIERLLLQIF